MANIGVQRPSYDEYVPHKLATVVEPEFVVTKYLNDNWIMFDARGYESRILGKIPKTVVLESDPDPYSYERHRWRKKESILKAVNDYLKRYRGYERDVTFEEFSNMNIVIFSSGDKCVRADYAACELRDLGVHFENIFLLNGGFPEWKAKGYPVR